MRVRPTRTSTTPRRLAATLRRPHAPAREEAAPEPEPEPEAGPASVSSRDDLADERRARESGGPDDRATYSCTCGYVFEADVTTSVACPHCGAAQAW